MQDRSVRHFHHRHNRDGTHDSICPACFMTVASTSQESALPRHEGTHKCDPVQLYQVSQYARHTLQNLESREDAPGEFTPRPRTA
jgi:hypothetical protein